MLLKSVWNTTGQEMGGVVNGYWSQVPAFPILVNSELERARNKHPKINSLHEGLAVIQEEFEELKAEIFLQNRDVKRVLSELIQLAAMAQRCAEDCLDQSAIEETW